jgi:hypothetical protein
MKNNLIWKIEITTRYGNDVVLIKQSEKPTQKQLDKIIEKWKKHFQIDSESEYPFIEVLGQIYTNKIPTIQQYLKQELC